MSNLMLYIILFVKRSDVTENPFQWLLGENKVIEDPPPHIPLY